MDKRFPLISVIVPVYNTGPYLKTCLDSIVNQTLTGLEIILVDDGSDDALTLDLLERYRRMDDRIQVIRKANGGQSEARNVGLLKAEGRYVAFVDHDDVLNLNMYQALFDAAENGGADVAECRYIAVPDCDVGKIDLKQRPAAVPREIRIQKDRDFLVRNIQIWKKICRREFLLDHDLRFDALFWEEDVVFSYKVLISAGTVVFIDASLYFHITHAANTTRKLGPKIFDAFKAHDLLRDFLNCHDCMDIFKDQYLGRVLKDVLFSLNAVHGAYERGFFDKAHERIRDISLKRLKRYYSGSKKKLLAYVAKGDFEGFKRYQAFRKKRKTLLNTIFHIRFKPHEKSIRLFGMKWMK